MNLNKISLILIKFLVGKNTNKSNPNIKIVNVKIRVLKLARLSAVCRRQFPFPNWFPRSPQNPKSPIERSLIYSIRLDLRNETTSHLPSPVCSANWMFDQRSSHHSPRTRDRDWPLHSTFLAFQPLQFSPAEAVSTYCSQSLNFFGLICRISRKFLNFWILKFDAVEMI